MCTHTVTFIMDVQHDAASLYLTEVSKTSIIFSFLDCLTDIWHLKLKIYNWQGWSRSAANTVKVPFCGATAVHAVTLVSTAAFHFHHPNLPPVYDPRHPQYLLLHRVQWVMPYVACCAGLRSAFSCSSDLTNFDTVSRGRIEPVCVLNRWVQELGAGAPGVGADSGTERG